MEFGSINTVVRDPDAALKAYLSIFGKNNIDQVIKLKGLNDTVDIIDGYYLMTKPIHIGIFRPRSSAGRMGKFLEREGEGTHHIELHMGQEEFERAYIRFKREGLPLSEKIIYVGKLSEAFFWIDESGEQGLPIKFATKPQRSLTMWKETEYLDTPQRFGLVDISDAPTRPGILVKSIMVTANDFEKHQRIWGNILSRPAVDIGDLFTNEYDEVNDGRGNIFVPLRYQFSGGGGINLYCAINKDAPINNVMAKRGKTAMYHNAAGYIVRDKVHECFRQWEDAGICMVDPKPLLNAHHGNANYFFFIHPRSAHGVLWEFVSMTSRDELVRGTYDYSDTEINIVPPDIS